MLKAIKNKFESYFQTPQTSEPPQPEGEPSPLLDLPLDIWAYCIIKDNLTNSGHELRTLLNLAMTSRKFYNIVTNAVKLLLPVQIPSGKEIPRYINIKYSSSLFSSIKMMELYWGMCKKKRAMRDSPLFRLQEEVERYHFGEFRPIVEKDIFMVHRLMNMIYTTEAGCTKVKNVGNNVLCELSKYDLNECVIDYAIDCCDPGFLYFGSVPRPYLINLLTYKFLAEILYDMFKIGRIILPNRHVACEGEEGFLSYLNSIYSINDKKSGPKKNEINIFKRFLCPVIDEGRNTKLVYASIGDILRLYYSWPQYINYDETENNFIRKIRDNPRCIPIAKGGMFYEYSIDVHVPYLLYIYSGKLKRMDK